MAVLQEALYDKILLKIKTDFSENMFFLQEKFSLQKNAELNPNFAVEFLTKGQKTKQIRDLGFFWLR